VSETEQDATATEPQAPASAEVEGAPSAEVEGAPTAEVEGVSPARARGERKLRTGIVVSEKMDKTVLVRIRQVVRHSAYGKTVRRSSKLAAHDEANDAHVGDKVRVMETRPLSKTKRWRVVEIVERAK
jgi:small subunit ribosomal protein S17